MISWYMSNAIAVLVGTKPAPDYNAPPARGNPHPGPGFLDGGPGRRSTYKHTTVSKSNGGLRGPSRELDLGGAGPGALPLTGRHRAHGRGPAPRLPRVPRAADRAGSPLPQVRVLCRR